MVAGHETFCVVLLPCMCVVIILLKLQIVSHVILRKSIICYFHIFVQSAMLTPPFMNSTFGLWAGIGVN